MLFKLIKSTLAMNLLYGLVANFSVASETLNFVTPPVLIDKLPAQLHENYQGLNNFSISKKVMDKGTCSFLYSDYKSCVFVYSWTFTKIEVTFDGEQTREITRAQTSVSLNKSVLIPDKHVKVVVKDTGFVLYDSTIHNWQGIECNDKECRPTQ